MRIARTSPKGGVHGGRLTTRSNQPRSPRVAEIVSMIPNGRSSRLPGGKPANVCAPDLLLQENAERGERVVAATASGCRGPGGACRRVLACPEAATCVRPRRDVLVTSSRWTPCALAQPLPDPASRPPNRSLNVPARAAWPLRKPRLSRHTRALRTGRSSAHTLTGFPPGNLPRSRSISRAAATTDEHHSPGRPPGPLPEASSPPCSRRLGTGDPARTHLQVPLRGTCSTSRLRHRTRSRSEQGRRLDGGRRPPSGRGGLGRGITSRTR